MSSKGNNTFKLILLLVLLIIGFYLLYNNRESKRGGSDFKKEFLSKKESELVDEILVKSKDNEELRLKKDTKGWFVKNQISSFEANQEMVENFIQELSNITSERLVARSKDKWKKFEVSDSLATVISVYKKQSLLNTIYIGKHSFPSKQSINTPKRSTPTKTYYRVEGFDEVFQTNGLIAFYTWNVNSWKIQEEENKEEEIKK